MAKAQWRSLLDALIILAHIVSDQLLEFVLGWILGPRKQCVPLDQGDTTQSLLDKSAVELGRLVRERKVKSVELVRAYCDRIRQVNPQINAVIDGPFEQEALEAARAVDAGFDEGRYSSDELQRKPFLGVPFTTKDSTAVGGKLHTLGLVSRRKQRADEDAECVRLMRASGAIIVATSSVPEVNKWIETRNMLIGQTRNPYDLRRSVGGSSGGEGALIASCASAFGLGTDIGGSIRIPAFNCGIFGHKSSMGAVNMRGCTFRTGKEHPTMVSAGPMCRHAVDLKAIFTVLAEPSLSGQLKLAEAVNVKKLRYFYMPSLQMKLCNPMQRDMQRVVYNVRNHFRSLTGREVEQTLLPETERSLKLWSYWMTQEQPQNFIELMGNGAEVNAFVELAKKLFNRSEFTMAGIYSLIDAHLPKGDAQTMQEATRKCKQALLELLGDDGVLFFPSSPRTAPFHYYPLLKVHDFCYFNLFNVLQVPVTQVPMGVDSAGLPLGIQVVAAPMNDRLCFAVAEELERQFGGWVSPCAKAT